MAPRVNSPCDTEAEEALEQDQVEPLGEAVLRVWPQIFFPFHEHSLRLENHNYTSPRKTTTAYDVRVLSIDKTRTSCETRDTQYHKITR